MRDLAGDIIAYAGEVMTDTTANREDPNEESAPRDELSGDEARRLSVEASKWKRSKVMWFNSPDGVKLRRQSHTDCAITFASSGALCV